MSHNRQETICCSQCGAKQDFLVWDSVNATVDPSLKKSLLTGDITTFSCSNCGNEAHVEFDCLYHDMDGSLAIWLKHPNTNGLVSIDQRAVEISLSFMEGYTRRMVKTLHELIDKIRIYDDGFIDYTIEMLKLLICIREEIDIEIPFHYSGIEISFLRQKSIAFVLAANEGLLERQYPLKQYLNSIKPLMPKIVASAEEEAEEWPHVNRSFMVRILERAGLMRALQ